jgi:hypothetical protein
MWSKRIVNLFDVLLRRCYGGNISVSRSCLGPKFDTGNCRLRDINLTMLLVIIIGIMRKAYSYWAEVKTCLEEKYIIYSRIPLCRT